MVSNRQVGDSNGFILYTAPTGKAAAVMRKRAGKKAFTMHQVGTTTLPNYIPT